MRDAYSSPDLDNKITSTADSEEKETLRLLKECVTDLITQINAAIAKVLRALFTYARLNSCAYACKRISLRCMWVPMMYF